MRFERLRLRDMGTYRGEVDIDFTAMPGPLVAISGPNGSGKTTLLELLAGALYRQTPTRGSLSSLARTREAYAEVKFVNGAAYTIRHTLDALSGKGEVLVLDAAGVPVLDSGKVRQFDDWAGAHLVDSDVLYASAFAVQGQRGFLDLSPSERKAVLVRVLGLQRLELLAARARTAAGETKQSNDMTRARLAELPELDLAALDVALQRSTEQTVQAAEGLRLAQLALQRARAAQQDAAAAAEIAAQRLAAQHRLNKATEEIADLQARIENNRGLLARKDEIEGAIARLNAMTSQLAVTKQAAVEAAADYRTHTAALQAQRSEVTRADQASGAARARVLRLEARLTEGPKIRQAAEALPELRQYKDKLAAQLLQLDAQAEEQQELMVGGKDQRIDGLRAGLSVIGAMASQPCEYARDTLSRDDALHAQSEQAPDALKKVRQQIVANRAARTKLDERLSEFERQAARLPALQAAEAELQVAYDEIASADAAVRTAREQEARAAALVVAAHAALDTVRAALLPVQAELTELAAYQPLAARFDQAQARIEELTAQGSGARLREQEATAELSALPQIQNLEALDLASFERAVATGESTLRDYQDASALARKAVEDGQVLALRRERLHADLQCGRDHHADWVRLSQDLGRDGLQAMELDAALPALNAMANDLLHECHGPRFTVELRTDRLSADGKRVLEDLDVRVIDTKEGRDALAETYSGGECVIVGEAVALSLTMLACQRSGFERPTLVRDESGAALDAQCAPHYVAMLRRAAQLIGAHRVLFVTHNPELQELADSVITITDDHRVQVS